MSPTEPTMDEQVSRFRRLAEEAVALVLLPIEGVTRAPVTVVDDGFDNPEVVVTVYYSDSDGRVGRWRGSWTSAGIRNAWPSPELLVRDLVRKLEARIQKDVQCLT